MPDKKPGGSVKKPKAYEALKDKRAAKASNAQANKERGKKS